MHISWFILVSKSTPFAFFIWIFTYIITFFCRRFVYIHTFFHHQIMCSCQLGICLYDIRQTSYERKLHHNHVTPSMPIWAEFYIHPRQDIPMVNSNRDEPPKSPCRFAPRDPIIYMQIFAGENGDAVIRTHAHEKIQVDFFRAEPLYVLYIAGKNVKNVRCARAYVRSTHRFFTSFE